MKRIYICGQINHNQLQSTCNKFKQITIELYAAGKSPVSPVQQKLWDINNPAEELSVRIKAMETCQEVFVLPCWNEDRLAQIELAAAIVLNKTIIYANDTIKPRQVAFYNN